MVELLLLVSLLRQLGDFTGDVNAGIATVGLTATEGMNVAGVITATTFKGILEGNLLGNVTGDVSGNLSGSLDVGIATVGFLTSTGNVNVAGILTSGTLVSDQLESRRATFVEDKL